MPFLLSYFRTEAEALHLAWSTDGLVWTALNENSPILRATVGSCSVRDPFIRRGPDDYYHLLSTDSWTSPNLLYTRTRNLVEWEPWRVLPAMAAVGGTENAWAPEFYYDPDRERYLLFWASVTPDRPYQRIWYTETLDFTKLAPPQVLFDPGYSVIDATLIPHEGIFYLAYKDERGENADGTEYKAMRVATAPTPLGPYTPQTGLLTPSLTEGPAIFRREERWLMLYDFFLHDCWGASESHDLLHWRPVSGLQVPHGARHGSVLSITEGELERLLRVSEACV